MNSYYEPVTRDFRQVHNRAAHAEWFESTEPGEEPTGQRITSVDRADLIARAMLGKLTGDIIANAAYAWKKGTPLPSRKNKRQPMQSND